eukprot:306847-Pelagomonas_calceolata.AAC.1
MASCLPACSVLLLMEWSGSVKHQASQPRLWRSSAHFPFRTATAMATGKEAWVQGDAGESGSF